MYQLKPHPGFACVCCSRLIQAAGLELHNRGAEGAESEGSGDQSWPGLCRGDDQPTIPHPVLACRAHCSWERTSEGYVKRRGHTLPGNGSNKTRGI